jgi:hypothetical protein
MEHIVVSRAVGEAEGEIGAHHQLANVVRERVLGAHGAEKGVPAVLCR